MGLDLLFAGWIIIAGLLGFRDGSVRKLTSLVMTGIALFAGHLLMRDAADVFMDMFNAGPSSAPILGFLAVFVGIVIIQSIVYKVATESYKIGGLADRVGGAILGVFQGMLFLSSLLFILSLTGVPSKATTKYSRIYTSIVNIAPQWLDLFTTVQTSSFEDLEKIARERGEREFENLIKRGEVKVDSLAKNRLFEEVQQKAEAAAGQLDSMRSEIRK